MRRIAAILLLGPLGACSTAGPAPAPTGPPHLVLHLGGLQPPPGVAADTVYPVTGDRAAQREALETGTWPGFPARYRIQEVLSAVGYDTEGEAAEGVPTFGFLVGDPPDPRPHTLVVSASLDPDARWLVLSGDAAPTKVQGPASVLDVMPTLLDAAGTVAPAGSPGRSLLDPGTAPAEVFFRVGPGSAWTATAGGRSLTWTGDGLQALAEAPLDDPRLRWLPEGAAPDEILRAALVRWQVSKARDPTAPALDPALQQVLQQRGYW